MKYDMILKEIKRDWSISFPHHFANIYFCTWDWSIHSLHLNIRRSAIKDGSTLAHTTQRILFFQ